MKSKLIGYIISAIGLIGIILSGEKLKAAIPGLNTIPSIQILVVAITITIIGVLILVFAMSRLVHMILYYLISTEKNPSPRSYFFIAGLVSNIALLALCGVALV